MNKIFEKFTEKEARETIEKSISTTITFFNLKCECRCSFFTLTEDRHIICQNCKRLFNLNLKEYKNNKLKCPKCKQEAEVSKAIGDTFNDTKAYGQCLNIKCKHKWLLK